MLKLDAKKHAAVSLAILIAVLMLFYALIIHPAVSSRMQFQERYEDLQLQFRKLGVSESKKNQLKKELEKLASRDTDRTGFLENKPAALAAADLQKYITTLIESSAGDLISTQVVQQKEVDIFPQVIVKVHLRGNIEVLRNILYRLNTDHPVLFVNNLLIQKRHGARGRRSRRGADLLDIRCDITGFMYHD